MFPGDAGLEGEFSMEDGRGSEVAESSFNVLVLGNFSGRREPSDLSSRRLIEVDRDNFGEVIRKMVPRSMVELPDGPLEIGFGDIEAFHPDSLYGQVGLFDELRTLRAGLKSNTDYELAARRVRGWVAPKTVEPTDEQPVPESAAGLLDEILVRDAGSARGSSLDSLVAEVLEPHLVRIDDDERAALIGAVDSAGEALMRTIVHSAGFREIESLWRGLFFLVRRFENDPQHRVFIVDVSKEELLEDLKSSDPADCFLVRVASDIDSLGLIAGCFDFEVGVDDVAALIRLSRIAAAVDAPFVSYVRGAAVGDEKFSEAQQKLWNALRDSENAEFLGLTPNRILGRIVYGARTEPIESFGFEEFSGEPDPDQMCWLNSAFAVALLSLRAHKEGHIVNQINKLPWFSYEHEGEARSVNCAEFDVNDMKLGAMLDAGLMPVVGFRNEDRATVPRFQSVSKKGIPVRGRLW